MLVVLCVKTENIITKHMEKRTTQKRSCLLILCVGCFMCFVLMYFAVSLDVMCFCCVRTKKHKNDTYENKHSIKTGARTQECGKVQTTTQLADIMDRR